MKPRVLFVYQLPAPFIEQDMELLGKHAEVRPFRWTEHRHPARTLSRWMLGNRRDYDAVFVWFGDLHATAATRAARMVGKPCILVAGGYDVSDVPGYGFLSTPQGLRRARAHFERATRILAVSEAVQSRLVARFPETAGKVDVLYLGLDAERFRPNGPRRRGVLSVAGADVWTRAWIKGWDRIAEVARALPDVPFRIVGASGDVPRRLAPPPNLEVLGHVERGALLPHYQGASVYLQASRQEALSMTVMEAMACGCVPVVTRVGGLPELVGDAGFIVEEDVAAIAEGVRRALDAPAKGGDARSRVLSHFTLRRREEGLVRALDGVLAPSSA
jgi:glycosyltransferase involved in cell wall biosynthesis